jgi:hypothetical protein
MSIEFSDRRSYRPSGKVHPSAWLYLVFVTVLPLPVLAFVYAFCSRHADAAIGGWLEIVIPLCAGFLGFGIAKMVDALVIRRGRVRHPRVALCMGFWVVLWTLYLQWVFWTEMVVTQGWVGSPWESWLQPALVWDRIVEINVSGTWTTFFKSDVPMPVNGSVLWGTWFFEVVLIGMWAPYRCFFNSLNPFCESRAVSYEKVSFPELNCEELPSSWIAKLEADPEAVLADIQLATPSSPSCLHMTLFHLDGEPAYLSMNLWTGGPSSRRAIELVPCIEINDGLRQSLLANEKRIRGLSRSV